MLVIDSVSVEAVSNTGVDAAQTPQFAPRSSPLTPATTSSPILLRAAGSKPLCISGNNYGPAISSLGPAIIVEKNATTVVERQWQAELSDLDHLILSQHSAPLYAAGNWALLWIHDV